MKKNISSMMIILSCLIFLTACAQKTYTRSNILLDTVVEITIYKGGSNDVLTESFDLISYYDELFDAFDPNSEIATIGTEPTEVTDETMELLKKNLLFYNLSDGKLNPYLGTLIELWNFSEEDKINPPTSEEIKLTLENITEQIEIDEKSNQVQLLNDTTKINLGASVKGLIADKLKEELVSKNVSSAIINLGGNVMLIGGKDGQDFTVGIDNPEIGETAPIATLRLKDKSIVTSGNYQRYFYDTDGNFYHHILNPETGYPVNNNLKEVVIVSDSSLLGDLLSTTSFIMGEEQAVEFIRENNFEENIGVIFVDNNDQIKVSRNLENIFALQPGFEKKYQVEYFDI